MTILTSGGNAGAGAGAVILFILLTGIAVSAYLAPSIVAFIRHVRDLGSVVVINVFLGWTLVGWVVALAMALRTAQVPRWAAGQVQDSDPEAGQSRARG